MPLLRPGPRHGPPGAEYRRAAAVPWDPLTTRDRQAGNGSGSLPVSVRDPAPADRPRHPPGAASGHRPRCTRTIETCAHHRDDGRHASSPTPARKEPEVLRTKGPCDGFRARSRVRMASPSWSIAWTRSKPVPGPWSGERPSCSPAPLRPPPVPIPSLRRSHRPMLRERRSPGDAHDRERPLTVP